MTIYRFLVTKFRIFPFRFDGVNTIFPTLSFVSDNNG